MTRLSDMTPPYLRPLSAQDNDMPRYANLRDGGLVQDAHRWWFWPLIALLLFGSALVADITVHVWTESIKAELEEME